MVLLSGLTALWTLGTWLISRQICRRRPPSVAPIAIERTQDPLAASRWLVARLMTGRGPQLFARLEELQAFGILHRAPVAVAIAPTDPAYHEVINWAHRASTQACAVGIIEPTMRSRNRKVAKLDAIACYAEQMGFEQVLFVDADIVLKSVAFSAIRDAFSSPSVGACCQASGSTPIERGLVTQIEAAIVNGSQQALPLLLRLSGRLVAGAVLALRLDVLRALGGWAQFGHLLGEDLALARALEKSTWDLVTVPTAAMAARSSTSSVILWERMVRWLGVLREQRPHILIAYPLMFFHTAPLCLLWGIAYRGGAPLGVALGGGALVVYSRLTVGREARLATTGGATWRQIVRDAFLSDLFLMAVWLRVLWAPARRWSGHQV